MGLKIDGIAASQAIDTSGESIIIENLDISSLQEGTAELIYEHKSPKDPGASPLDILGAITYAKKIFNASDCSNDRERMYWKQIELPFLYIQAELFDEHPGAEALAAIIRWYHKRKLPILMRYSIDGNTLERDKSNPNILRSCIARSVAITVRPCNQSCVSGVLDEDLEAHQDGKVEEVQKSGGFMSRLPGVECWVTPVLNDPMQLIKNEQEFLSETEELEKAVTAGGYDMAPMMLSGGSAQQKEDFAIGSARKKAVRRLQASVRDWDGKGSLKDHLEKTLADVHPQFIAKFCEALDSFHLKKSANLAGLLEQAMVSDVLVKAESPLTVGGAVIAPNVGMVGPVFDSLTSSLVTPRGTFKMTVPPVGDHKLLARCNAGRKLAAQSPSDALKLTALMIGTNKLDHELPGLLDSLRGVDVEAVHEKLDSLGLDPKSSRLTAALLGASNVLVPGDECHGALFGLGTKDEDSHRHLHDTFSSSHRLLQDVEGHVGRGLNGMSLQDAVSAWALNDESNGDPAVKVVSNVLKSEDPEHWTLARRCKDLFMRWTQRYGQAKARMLYMTHLVPILTAGAGASLQKAEGTADLIYKGLSGNAPAQASLPQPVDFRGKKVMPGKLVFHDGHLQGQEFALLGKDDGKKMYIVKDHANLNRPMGIPMDDEHRAFKITSEPKEIKQQLLTDATHHVIGNDPNIGIGIDFHPEAVRANKFSVDGIHASKGLPPFFTKNALGQRVFVKPHLKTPWVEAEGVPAPIRETAAKMIADHLGLGEFVPQTATIKHPKTGELYSVQEVIPNAEHGVLEGAKKQHWQNAEKLSAFDFLIGNVDRHGMNFVHTDDKPGLKLFDHGYAFGYHSEYMLPEYVHKTMVNKPFDHQTQLWIAGINPNEFANTMAKAGLSQKHIKAAVARLTYLKLLTVSGKPITHRLLAKSVPESKQ